MPAAPSRHFQGLASPSPVSVTSNKDSRIYRTSHGLWAQLSSNTCLEKKRSFRGRSVKICGAAHHTDRLLTRSRRTGQPLAANALPHGNLLHDRLVLGFKVPYHTQDFLEHCVKSVCRCTLLTGQEKEKFRPWANFQMRFSSFTISVKVSKASGPSFI